MDYPVATTTPPPGYTVPPSGTPGVTPPHRGGHGKTIAIVAAVIVVVLAAAIGTIVALSGSQSSDKATASIDRSADTSRSDAAPSVTDAAATELGGAHDSTLAPTTTVPKPRPGVPVLLPGVTDPNHAVPIIQQLATALAHHDWNGARAAMPSLNQTDAQLQAGYGALHESTVIVTSEFDDAYEVDGAYLAWEQLSSGAKQTSVYCVHWEVDSTSQQVASQESTGTAHTAEWTGWVDPATVAAQVQSLCS